MSDSSRALVLELLLLAERFELEDIRKATSDISRKSEDAFFRELPGLIDAIASSRLRNKPNLEAVASKSQKEGRVRKKKAEKGLTVEEKSTLEEVTAHLGDLSLHQLRSGAIDLKIDLPKRATKAIVLKEIAIALSKSETPAAVILERTFGGPPEPADAFQLLADGIMGPEK